VKKETIKVATKSNEIQIKGNRFLSTLRTFRINQLARKAAPVERTNILGRLIGSYANQGVMAKVAAVPVAPKTLTIVVFFSLFTETRLS